MLQLPVIALEQRIKQELEVNPMLEELGDVTQEVDNEFEPEQVSPLAERRETTPEEVPTTTGSGEEKQSEEPTQSESEHEWEEFISDEYDDFKTQLFNDSDDEEQEEIPQRSESSLADDLLAQLRMQTMTEDDLALAEEIIGNIDEHGYLRRDLAEIVDDLNKFMAATRRAMQQPQPTDHQLGDGQFDSYEEMLVDSPFGRERLVSHLLHEQEEEQEARRDPDGLDDLPVDPFSASFDDDDMPVSRGSSSGSRDTVAATTTAAAPVTATSLSIEEMSQLSIEDLARLLEQGTSSIAPASNGHADPLAQGEIAGFETEVDVEPFFSLAEAERILHRIQRLEPPGIGARDLRECLLVQLELLQEKSEYHQLAMRVIADSYTEFTMKHFEKICDRLKCTTDDLKEAVDVIRTLNPKPGAGSVSIINDNYLTPDFVIERDVEDFIIIPNDRHIPTLRINRAYQELMRRGKAKKNGIDRDTRKFLREKFEAAKWFIASIQQRRQTMMKVMRAIVDLQNEFFIHGPSQIRPMIYKDVAEKIGMDISTVCRVVNGKYVQTDYGTFELRYFFSEKLETTSGEEVSTKIVKSRIEELIAAEDKSKPLSDDAISKEMKVAGFFVARRTVAKYREQMNIPVARLRRAL
jgi:RNA polymerase sigma-54 factor